MNQKGFSRILFFVILISIIGIGSYLAQSQVNLFTKVSAMSAATCNPKEKDPEAIKQTWEITKTGECKKGLLQVTYQCDKAKKTIKVACFAYDFSLHPSRGAILSIQDGNTTSKQALLRDTTKIDDVTGEYKVVVDQSGFSYRWTIEPDPTGINAIEITPYSFCTNGINEPCPKDHVRIKPLAPGYAHLLVELIDNSTNTVITNELFSFSVLSESLANFQILFPQNNTTLKVGNPINLEWSISSNPVDYYNIYYFYPREGTIYPGFIGQSHSPSTSFTWTPPDLLQEKSAEIIIDAIRGEEVVGTATSKYFFIRE